MFKSQNANFFRTQQNTVNNGTEATSELLREQARTSKIDEKLVVFWDLDFGWISGGFWDGFSMVFRIVAKNCDFVKIVVFP